MDKLRSKILIQDLRLGDVIYLNLYPEDGLILKNYNSRKKYFLYLGSDGEKIILGGLLINSKINQNLPPEIKDHHYPLSKNTNTFLEHDSFVNCGELFKIPIDRLEGASIIGKIYGDDLSLIISTLQTSPLIAPIDLLRFNLLP